MRWLVNGEEHEFKEGAHEFRVDGDLIWVKTEDGWKSAAVIRKGNQTFISYRGRQYELEPSRKSRSELGTSKSGEIKAPMPGLIVSVLVKVGDKVKKGDSLVVLEAMKTQVPLTAPFDGSVVQLAISATQQVKTNQILAIIE